MIDSGVLVAVGLTFLLAGMVKGVIGLGLPTVSLALLTATLGLPQAMALLLVPSFATNLWQALSGGNGRTILRRLWPFLVMATVTVWVGALALTRADPALLSGLLGVLLVVYSAINLAGARVTVPAAHEAWLGPVFGATNGVLTGMTGSFVVPGVMYLQAIGLPRDMLVQAMGILFTLSTAALALALGGSGLLNAELGTLSAAALAPALAGMVLGQKIRGRLSETAFRRVLFVGLFILGLYLTADLFG
ncbi:sulfite exporter TauE/SafE family protein [Aquamicrobium sp. LC103]|uniref:sulfite exporter TauE/SafE family protein n=1 Tax=Aquamicrobium sp. LC103 TaxID=1120658 RepID=UPI00063EBA91|nr:sulfite exporter TauE/SafE family protein [Aquamicrobium sp. LC103]TKT76720.1 sulfite exporter TauE/SafE family protein [Aquamicrobium sp. LC103]